MQSSATSVFMVFWPMSCATVFTRSHYIYIPPQNGSNARPPRLIPQSAWAAANTPEICQINKKNLSENPELWLNHGTEGAEMSFLAPNYSRIME